MPNCLYRQIKSLCILINSCCHLIESIKRRRRMEGSRLPVVALYRQVEGTKSRGRQPKKWVDNVKEDLTAQGKNMREAVDNSRNRRIWRSLVESANAWRRRNWILNEDNKK